MTSTTSTPAAVNVPSGREAHLRTILETQPTGLTRIGGDGAFLALNEAALAMWGAERLEQVLGTSLMDWIQPEDSAACAEFLTRTTAGERRSCEVRITSLTGLECAVRLRGVPLFSDDGVPSVLCALIDVTEHLQFERTLVMAAAREKELVASHAAERERIDLELTAAREQAAALEETAGRCRELEQKLQDTGAHAGEAAQRQAEEHARLVTVANEAQQAVDAAVARHAELVAELETRLQEREREAQNTQVRFDELHTSLEQSARRERELQQQLENRVREREDETEAARAELHELRASLDWAIVRDRELQEQHAGERAQHEQALAAAATARSALGARLVTAVLERSAAEAAIVRSNQIVETARATLANATGLVDMLQGVLAEGQLASIVPGDGPPSPPATLAQDPASAVPQAPDGERAAGREGGSPGAILGQLEPVLRSMLPPEIALEVACGSDAVVNVPPGEIELLLLTLVANRRASMLDGGQVTIEIADVELDDEVATARGARQAGPYVLLAVHASGPGVLESVPSELFGAPSTSAVWLAAGPGFATVHHLTISAGGHLWAQQEPGHMVAFETYLPRLGRAPSRAAADAGPTATGGERGESTGDSNW